MIWGDQALPSKKELPDYYKIVQRPVDLNRIRGRVESGWYASEDLDLYRENVWHRGNGKKVAPGGPGGNDRNGAGGGLSHGGAALGGGVGGAAAAAAGVGGIGGGAAASASESGAVVAFQMWCGYEADIALMFDNARLYNQTDSIVVKDADVMLREFQKRSRGKRKEMADAVKAAVEEELERRRRKDKREKEDEETKAHDGAGVKEEQAAAEAGPAVDGPIGSNLLVKGEPTAGGATEGSSAAPASIQADPSPAGVAKAPPEAAAAAAANTLPSAPADSGTPWSVHGLVPVVLEIIDPEDTTKSRRFVELITWDLNPENQYTPMGAILKGPSVFELSLESAERM